MSGANNARSLSDRNLDVELGVLPPVKQQLVLLNRNEVKQANDAARQLSIEALARAEASS